jgi:hypothetical protein
MEVVRPLDVPGFPEDRRRLQRGYPFWYKRTAEPTRPTQRTTAKTMSAQIPAPRPAVPPPPAVMSLGAGVEVPGLAVTVVVDMAEPVVVVVDSAVVVVGAVDVVMAPMVVTGPAVVVTAAAVVLVPPEVDVLLVSSVPQLSHPHISPPAKAASTITTITASTVIVPLVIPLSSESPGPLRAPPPLLH